MKDINTFLGKLIMVVAMLVYSEGYPQNIAPAPSGMQTIPIDLQVLLGDWTGTLTYLDYSSGKPYTMPSNLLVAQGKNEFELVIFHIYPNEPNANNKEKLAISKNGEFFNKKKIKSIQRLPSGELQIITENKARDNKKKALIKQTYFLSHNHFVVRKEVQFENSTV